MGQGEGGDHRIASARDIENLLRPGGDGEQAIGPHQHHPLGRAGDQNGRDAIACHDRAGGGGAFLIAATGLAGGQRHLRRIGGDAGGPGIAVEIGALGVHEDRQSGRAQPRQHRRREHALAVIGEDDGIGARRQGSLDGGQQARGLSLALRPRRLVIDAHHLLVAGHHAQLGGGGAGGAFHQPVLDGGIGDGVAQRLTARADEADQRGPRAECGDIARHIACATGHGTLPPAGKHRHRRLGRDALDAAVEVAVKHHIADHQHMQGGEIQHQPAPTPCCSRSLWNCRPGKSSPALPRRQEEAKKPTIAPS